METTVKELVDDIYVSEILEELFPELLISPLLTVAYPYRFCDAFAYIAGKLDRKKVADFKARLQILHDKEEIRLEEERITQEAERIERERLEELAKIDAERRALEEARRESEGQIEEEQSAENTKTAREDGQTEIRNAETDAIENK